MHHNTEQYNIRIRYQLISGECLFFFGTERIGIGFSLFRNLLTIRIVGRKNPLQDVPS